MTQDIEKVILETIERNQAEYLEFLRSLIKVDSSNPPGNEMGVAVLIEEFLKKHNVKTELHPFDVNRANLVAYLNEDFDHKNLLYNGHMDVVPVGKESDWTKPPFSAEIRDGFIYGRGTTDMKSGLAAMAISLSILKQLDVKLDGNLILNAVSEEETGGIRGTKWILDNVLKEIKIDFAIIGEFTGIKNLTKGIMIGEKGSVKVKIKTTGKSAHASLPFEKNAIESMGEFIANLDHLKQYLPDINPPLNRVVIHKMIQEVLKDDVELLDILKDYSSLSNILEAITGTTFCLTMIKGGIKENINADNCELIMDFRMLPRQDKRTVSDALNLYIKSLGLQNISFKMGVSIPSSMYPDWKRSEELKLLEEVIEQSYEKKPIKLIYPASTDAEFYRASGLCPKTILFGPGNIDQAHSVDERVEISDFLNAIKCYALFAVRYITNRN